MTSKVFVRLAKIVDSAYYLKRGGLSLARWLSEQNHSGGLRKETDATPVCKLTGIAQQGLSIMLRNKTATYALLSLYEIGRQQAGATDRLGVRAHDIANKHKLPKAYVAKILSQLANAGILHSDRGPRGGFRLNATTQEISLFDVFNSVGAIVGSESARAGVKGLPTRVQGAMTRAHEGAAAKLKELYSQTTLADILGDEGAR